MNPPPMVTTIRKQATPLRTSMTIERRRLEQNRGDRRRRRGRGGAVRSRFVAGPRPGVAAMAAPKYLPKMAGALSPLFKSTVRGTYKLAQKSKEVFAEAHEHVNDIVAEVRAESDGAEAQPSQAIAV